MAGKPFIIIITYIQHRCRVSESLPGCQRESALSTTRSLTSVRRVTTADGLIRQCRRAGDSVPRLLAVMHSFDVRSLENTTCRAKICSKHCGCCWLPIPPAHAMHATTDTPQGWLKKHGTRTPAFMLQGNTSSWRSLSLYAELLAIAPHTREEGLQANKDGLMHVLAGRRA